MRARHRHFNPRFAGANIALDSRYGFSQSDGTAVSTWTSRTGSNDATQATATNRPTYETNEQGGQPIVRFDGLDNFLSYSNSCFSYTSGATVVALVKITASANQYGAIIGEFASNTAFPTNTSIGCMPQVYPNNAIEPATDVYAPAGMRYNSTLSNSTWYIICWSWSNWSTHKTNGNTILAQNGTEVSGAAYGSNPSGFTSAIKSIGRFDSQDGSAGGAAEGNFVKGDFAIISALSECSAALRRRLYHSAAYSFKLACS